MRWSQPASLPKEGKKMEGMNENKVKTAARGDSIDKLPGSL
jgi:hypothetical protein